MNINRLRAEEDLRLLNILAVSESAEGFKKMTQALDKEQGVTVELEKDTYVQMEQGAYEKLKRLRDGK